METKSKFPEGGRLTETAIRRLGYLNIAEDEQLTETSGKALIEVEEAISNEDISDREAMEKAAAIFEKYNIKANVKCDFD